MKNEIALLEEHVNQTLEKITELRANQQAEVIFNNLFSQVVKVFGDSVRTLLVNYYEQEDDELAKGLHQYTIILTERLKDTTFNLFPDDEETMIELEAEKYKENLRNVLAKDKEENEVRKYGLPPGAKLC